jgi:hypothetical protein
MREKERTMAANIDPIPAGTEGSHLWYVVVFLLVMIIMGLGVYQAYDTFTTQQSVVRQLTAPNASRAPAESAAATTAADE